MNARRMHGEDDIGERLADGLIVLAIFSAKALLALWSIQFTLT